MPEKTTLFPSMEDTPDISKLIDMLRRALPYLQGYDLMGCGPRASKREYTELNDLEKEIAKAIGEDPADYGYHNSGG